MKTTAILLIALIASVPFLFSKDAVKNHSVINGLESIDIKADLLAEEGQTILLVYWDSGSEKIIELMQDLHDVREGVLCPERLKIVGVYNGNGGSYDYIQPSITGAGLDVEVYADPTGELQRRLGLSSGINTLCLDSDLNILESFNGYKPGTVSAHLNKIGQDICNPENPKYAATLLIE